MKTIYVALLCCLICVSGYGQTAVPPLVIKGIVIDSAKKEPLGYVTVAVKDVATKQPIKTALSHDNGSFELKVTSGKSYQAVFAFVGYQTKTVNISVKNGTTDLGKISLPQTTGQLKEVSVTDVRPLMKREVDRISYDVQADPESKAITALDMMRKVPLLSVDGNDNIKLKGSGNYKILINGKESALMSKNPSDVLKSMPATNIEKIEVITTPPAKYDAEGLAGIINIITKKNADQGYNGSINGRYNNVWGPGINVNGTVKQGKFGLSGYVGMNKQREQHVSAGNKQMRFIDQSVIDQHGTNYFGGHNVYGDAELSYEIDTLNLLTGSFNFYGGKFDQGNDQLSSQILADNSILQQYHVNGDGYYQFKGMDASLNYQLGFKHRKDELLTLSYKYSYSPNKQFNKNIFSDRLNYPETQFPDYQQYNRSGLKEHTFQLDYVYPFKKLNIEAGAKAILRNNFSDIENDTYNSTNQSFLRDTNLSYNFKYQQNVYSIYNSYQLKLTKWSAKAGLRIEHTTIDATGVSVNQDYNNFIPSVSLQRSFKSSSINLGYTERIQRPSIWQLNPFVDATNSKFVNVGNPNLRPELNHVFELSYSNFSKGSINASLSYSFSNNSIQNVTSLRIDSVPGSKPDTVTTTTYQNLGSNKALGLNLSANYSITKKFTINVNTQLNHVWLRGTYNDKFYTNLGFTGNAFATFAYKFDDGYRLALNAGYFSGDVTLQGKNKYFIYTSYVASKEFLKKKATISLVANNPYYKYYTFTSYTRTPDFYQTSYNQIPYRHFAIRFNYKFGKLSSDIKKNQRGINNDDTKAGGKSSGNQ